MFYFLCFYALEFILQLLQILTVETEVDFGGCLVLRKEDCPLLMNSNRSISVKNTFS